MAEHKIENLKTGTTTAGILCKGAVVLGAERKATMGYLVANKNAKKILDLDEHVAMTIAGLVGDAQALERYIKAELKLYRLQEGKRINVGAAASLVSNILYSSRYYPYYVQLIVGGYDTQPKLYSFDPSGSIQDENDFVSTGSGSPVAYGVLEDGYKKDMTVEDARKLIVRAISAARERDIASGGSGIDVVVIDSKGIHRFSHDVVQKTN